MLVQQQEKKQQGVYLALKKDRKQANLQKTEKEKQLKNALRSQRPVANSGKHDAFRSEKVKIKKEKKMEVVD